MQMNGLAELITVKRYWKDWTDPRFVVLVLNNRDLNQVTWEMRAMSGYPKFPASQDLPDFPYARYAEDLGLLGLRVDRPQDVGAVWDKAFAANRPVLVEAVTDPEVPPLPPHISLEHAKGLARAILKGDPGRADIVRQAYSQMIGAKIGS